MSSWVPGRCGTACIKSNHSLHSAAQHMAHLLGGMPASALSAGVNSVLACTRKAPRVAVVYDSPAICAKLAALLYALRHKRGNGENEVAAVRQSSVPH